MSNQQELESDHYDVIVIGTGLAESIAAASLAKAGKNVLHLDPNEYYGGEQASLTLDEYVDWSKSHENPPSASSSSSSPYSSPGSSSTSTSTIRYRDCSATPLTPELEDDRRRYAISLFPSILPSRGHLIDTLIKSYVSKYVSFRILDQIALYSAEGQVQGEGTFKRVPGSKEEIFKDKSISLIDKRKLMKFLLFATGEFETDDLLKGKESQPLSQFLSESFSIPPSLSESIVYAISHCSTPDEPTLGALKRTRRYLRSIGRYGNNAFLIGQYGGAGEVAQGFCRACAVFGGTYVLGPSARPTNIESTSEGVLVNIPCHPRAVTASHLIASPNNLPSSVSTSDPPPSSPSTLKDYVTLHGVAITKTMPDILRRKTTNADPSEAGASDITEEVENDDTAVILFPRDGQHVVKCYINGEGTGSCPAGQYIIYLSTSIPSSHQTMSPSETLKPYLDKITSSAIFEGYYISTRPSSSDSSGSIAQYTAQSDKVVVLSPYGGKETLTEGLDWEALQGEEAYHAIMGRGDGTKGFFEKDVSEEEEMGIGEDD
ncbi:uncharacterized protein I303_102843 [Kwoniella dejecticola CBS 10117]|uniref:Rab proteins geranylgeranyltransferase n=1 Tax=Kwoniella dejecticola CBS 10117 TaxID=1296121 RepID=A0A1A6A9V7_9TREE|nr:uncharacterized protein I303_02857 [Kwoniella dejecticola CBS 10117]OBR86840.1 hypothetical protein I303_02857 [Kwoniella dejecticola CBS 10117]